MKEPEHKYPLLYKPRPWSAVGDQPGEDARWKGIEVDQIDILDRMDIQHDLKVHALEHSRSIP